eukprot:gene4963-9931_t
MGQRKKRKSSKPNSKEKDDDSDSKDLELASTMSSAENKAFYDQYMATFCPDAGNATNAEAFQKFAAAGGEKCIKFFQTLFNSWRENGTLPPLSEDEAAMLNQMYQLWLENNGKKNNNASIIDNNSNNMPSNQANNNTNTNTKPSCVHTNTSLTNPIKNIQGSQTVTLATLKDMVSVHKNEVLTSLVSQMEILLKAPEPTRTQARELLEILLSIEFSRKKFHILEKRADEGEPSFALAMAIIHEKNTELNKRCVKLYLQAANKDNSIACMQLGAKYLKGDGVRADNKVAFRWYMRAANLENPIAQHKLGYFYDEGLEGACTVNISEAVRCYSRASELMPDSMHNLAKIYEDGRGNIQSDMKQAVTLYSVAAARGFPLSQVNLGRLFLLGEDGVRRDREAGKRLLTLAAESGDCDAQMVVGMIHVTSAFQCCDLPLAEYWLRQSLAGGKVDAERLLMRVCQQMEHANTPSLSMPLSQVSQDSKAAMQRGHDYLGHGLVHAAILEFTRAFVLDRSQLNPLVDRLEALSTIGHYEDCLADCLELLTTHAPTTNKHKKLKGISSSSSTSSSSTIQQQQQSSSSNTKQSSSSSSTLPSNKQLVEVILSPDTPSPEHTPVLSGELLDRVYTVLSGNIAETHGHSPSYPNSGSSNTNTGTNNNSNGNGNVPNTPTLPTTTFDLFKDVGGLHRGPLIGHLLCRLLEVNSGSTNAINSASKAAAFLVRLTSQGKRHCQLVTSQGGIPIIIAALISTQNWFDHSLPAQQQIITLPHLLPLWCDSTGILVNITKYQGLVGLIIASDGLTALIRLSRRAMPHARVASAALQAIGNLAVLADDMKTWADLMSIGTKDAFLAALSVPMDDLVDLPPSAKEAEIKVRGQGARWQERRDRLELLVVVVVTLGRVLQVTVTQGSGSSSGAGSGTSGTSGMGQRGPGPGGLARDLAMSSAVSSLQLLFRSNILPSGLRATTAFVLYKLLCALDPGASQMLKDPESRAEVREQLQRHQQGKMKIDPKTNTNTTTPTTTSSSSGGSTVVDQMFTRISKRGRTTTATATTQESLTKEQRARLLVVYSVDVSRASLELPATAGVGAGTSASVGVGALPTSTSTSSTSTSNTASNTTTEKSKGASSTSTNNISSKMNKEKDNISPVVNNNSSSSNNNNKIENEVNSNKKGGNNEHNSNNNSGSKQQSSSKNKK